MPVVGIELGRAYGEVEGYQLALSVARWVHNSTSVTFPEAPRQSRTAEFLEVQFGNLAYPPRAFLDYTRFKR